MRKQYYFRSSDGGVLAWDVDRLVALSRHLPRVHIPLNRIRELDDASFGTEKAPTWRAMVEHVKLMDAADLAFPIILSASGAVMDGMHRVAKALLHGLEEIEAVQFTNDPDPDYVGVGPDDLSY